MGLAACADAVAVNAMTANVQTMVFIIILLTSVKHAPECGSEPEKMHGDGERHHARSGDGEEQF